MFKNIDIDYWKKYRQDLTKALFETDNIEKTPQNIYDMAKKSGIKPTARFFNIQPSTVRYYIKKLEQKNDNFN